MPKSTSKKDNPMTMISLRLPEAMVTELKRLAPLVGESGYQPLIRTYIEHGLAADAKKIDGAKSIDYIEERAKAVAKQASKRISEPRAEYIVGKPPDFEDSSLLEWGGVVYEEATEENWGMKVTDLLNSLSETGWEDVDDPVMWVNEARKERRNQHREAQETLA